MKKTTTPTIILLKLATLKAGQMLLACKSVGNPDFGQYAPLSDAEYFIIDNFEQAGGICRAYIEMWDLGGGNFPSAPIYNQNAELVAEVSYNGRVWNMSTEERTEIKVAGEAVERFRLHYKAIYDKMIAAYCEIIKLG